MNRFLKGTVIIIAVLVICWIIFPEKINNEKEASIEIVEEKVLIPSGQSIGVKMDVAGVLVTDVENECDVKVGDEILSIEGIEVNSAEEVKNIVKEYNGKMDLIVLREGKKIRTEITPVVDENGNYILGLWIKDKTAGIGTLTYYDPDNNTFAALGHPITDHETGKSLKIERGQLLESEVIKIRKSTRGTPGEIHGVFKNSSNPLGILEKNCSQGIYGRWKETPLEGVPLKLAKREQIKKGKAYILTTIDDNKVEKYRIEIEEIDKRNSNDTKDMVIHVTDKTLIDKCGGIVQGMSGSPIIQDDKIIGAVTHVFVNDPTRGYGIFIDRMLY